jgi:hypothetical protein
MASRILIDASGNIGINTTNPGFTLDVNGNTRIGGTWPVCIGEGNTNAGSEIKLMRNGTKHWSIRNTSTGNLAFEDTSAFSNGVGSVGNTFMCIGPTGNVGIGTTAPNYTLDVNGNIEAASAVISYNGFFDSLGIYTAGYAHGVTIQARNATNTSNKILALNPSGGNVGINTTNPTVALDVTGNGRFTGNMVNGGFDFVLGNTDQSGRGNSGLSRALVKNTGSVLQINFANDFSGGTEIQSKLTVSSGIVNNGGTSQGNNAISFGTGAGANINWGSGPFSQIYDDGNLHIWTDDVTFFDRGGSTNGLAGKPSNFTTWMYAGNTGLVGINTTVPTQTLDVNGTIARSGVRLPRFDNGTFSGASAAIIPILFSDTTYNYVEVKASYQISTGGVNVTLRGDIGTNGSTGVASLSEHSEITTLWNAGTGGNIRTTSAFLSQNTESLGITANVNIKIARAVANGGSGSGRNHYSFDTVYCWAGTGTARVYGQGHMDTDNTQSVNQLRSILMTPSSGTISGTWSTQHSY